MHPYRYTKVNTEKKYIQRYKVAERGRKVIAQSFMLVALSLFTYIGGYYALWNVKEQKLASEGNFTGYLASVPNSLNKNNATNLNQPVGAAASEGVNKKEFPDFTLSIPTLKIGDAKVKTDVMSNNEDIYNSVLLHSLAHYRGTAYPGGDGNVIIYGHSILPAFYNPKNYLSIFSTLDTLKKEDQIYVSWGDDIFTYQVEAMEIVSPTDTRVLNYKNGKTLTLITCVPPGMTSKRLLVFARLL